jgi:DNA-binding IclR family transcriptional regulator
MLVYRDFAIQDEHRVYHAGPMLSLGPVMLENTAELREVAIPHLRRLSSRVGESSYLLVLTGSHCRFLVSAECTKAIRVENRDGAIQPAHLTSAGLAMLSQLTPAQVERLFSPARLAHLPGEAPDLTTLIHQLQQVRERGFAVTRELAEVGVTAVGCALRLPDSSTPAGISLAIPSSRFREYEIAELVRALNATARAIEKDMTRHTVKSAS